MTIKRASQMIRSFLPMKTCLKGQLISLPPHPRSSPISIDLKIHGRNHRLFLSMIRLYDDDIFNGILDLDKPAYDDDERMVDAQLELFMHIAPDKATNALSIIDNEIGMTKLEHGKHLGSFAHSDKKFMKALVVDADICMVDPFGVEFNSILE
ncbi:Heat shock protein 81-1 [Dendrobium catenatum]|uniref:Heat shock protein 81-1 n=1 Tax=Dendrobium catenatum TaxID=906689 RepID=A0A2I0W641_9ASPA|nr:Heat shock protein 81-1 [Dendrobium catenatum]